MLTSLPDSCLDKPLQRNLHYALGSLEVTAVSGEKEECTLKPPNYEFWELSCSCKQSQHCLHQLEGDKIVGSCTAQLCIGHTLGMFSFLKDGLTEAKFPNSGPAEFLSTAASCVHLLLRETSAFQSQSKFQHLLEQPDFFGKSQLLGSVAYFLNTVTLVWPDCAH